MVLLGTGDSSEGKTDLFARSGRREGGARRRSSPGDLASASAPGPLRVAPGSQHPPAQQGGGTHKSGRRPTSSVSERRSLHSREATPSCPIERRSGGEGS